MMAADVLGWLFEGFVATSAAILVVLMLRRGCRTLFGAQSVPLLWAAVPLAWLAVALPAPVHVSEVLPQTAAAVSLVPTAHAGSAATPLSGIAALLVVWSFGSLVAALAFARQQRRFRRRLGQLGSPRGAIRYAQHTGVGPAVLGLLRPCVVLPADFARRYSAQAQRLIIAHEHSHLRRGDLFAVAIATGLRVVYWFNPLMHYAAARLRHDHELASDAEVMKRFPSARRRYAETLLNVQLADPGLPVGCLWQSSHPLKERIMMLHASTPSSTRRRLGAAVGTSILLAVAASSWAAQPTRNAAPSTAASVDAKAADVSMREAASIVAERAGLTLLDASALSNDRMVSFEFNSIPAEIALGLLAEEAGLRVVVQGDTVRFVPSNAPHDDAAG
jgi:bla regulator protein blaR1